MSDRTQGTLSSLLRERARIDSELRRHQAEVTILFTDIVGSTAYYDRFGNTAGFMQVQRHDDIAKPALDKFKGRHIKSTGDGMMASFPDPVAAVRAAIQMQRDSLARNQTLPEAQRLQMRIGINAGAVFERGGDVWGDAVNVAARVCAKCEPAQIVISSTVHARLKSDASIRSIHLGRFELKGKKEQEDLYEVPWADLSVYQPVRSDITKQVAAGTLVKRDLEAPLPQSGSGEMPVIGVRFADRYEILEELGEGGMGVVFKVRDEETGEVLALKVLRKDIAADSTAMERFKNELRVARRITHPKVCRVYEFARAAGTAYISMEFVEGMTLRSLIEQQVAGMDDFLNIALDLCEGLAEVHRQNAIHRDLKPANVMVTTAQEVKLMDFGISRLGNTGLTATGNTMGTPRYMAPEQVLSKPVDTRTDVYSLGLTLYEMLAGEPAFDGDSSLAVAMKQVQDRPQPPRELQPEIPEEVERIILRCLQKDPRDRYESANEVRADLVKAAGATAIEAAERASRAPVPHVPQQTRVNPRDGSTYIWIPAGSFERGASPNDREASLSESPRHPVTLSRGFWIAATPVTILAYKRYAKETGVKLPSENQPNWSDNCPVVGVTYDEAIAYCAWAGGRLPSDAEWEYAARAGYTGPRYGDAPKVAWFRVSPPGPRPVGGKEPNAWGLYDVLGNVWEWCADWFEEYRPGALVDPHGDEQHSFRIIRGGSWDDHPAMARLSVRSWQEPDYHSNACGFRCVLDEVPSVL